MHNKGEKRKFRMDIIGEKILLRIDIIGEKKRIRMYNKKREKKS